MPTYEFACETCGHTTEIRATFQDVDAQKPEICEKCGSTEIERCFGIPQVFVPHTVGSKADRNARYMSDDHIESLQAKKKKEPAFAIHDGKIVHTKPKGK